MEKKEKKRRGGEESTQGVKQTPTARLLSTDEFQHHHSSPSMKQFGFHSHRMDITTSVIQQTHGSWPPSLYRRLRPRRAMCINVKEFGEIFPPEVRADARSNKSDGTVLHAGTQQGQGGEGCD